MTLPWWALFLAFFSSASLLPAQCAKDNRTDKNSGILIADFTIVGTQTISASDLARITGDMTGSCYDENSEEMEERVRASFQDRGYFQVEVKSLRVKPRDPLGVPKPVTLEGEVSEGPQYRLGQVTFLKNHAFAAEELRNQFPLKKGALMKRDKIAMGLEGLRKLYGTRGYLDFVSIPETTFSSNAVANLSITLEEGAQYHMGKLEIHAGKELTARLSAQWELTEGQVYDQSYLDRYMDANRALLPSGSDHLAIGQTVSCPERSVDLRLVIVGKADGESVRVDQKYIPCEEKDTAKKDPAD